MKILTSTTSERIEFVCELYLTKKDSLDPELTLKEKYDTMNKYLLSLCEEYNLKFSFLQKILGINEDHWLEYQF